MSGEGRPHGRRCALAQTALATMKEREKQEREVASATVALAPTPALWLGAIRLIDLERRARFAQLAS